ncbi:MAG: hypothetical protein OIF32_04515, partial [Campylobacterales bacterium]|nr:hypothetical protein [Campylobacterales bacterium]
TFEILINISLGIAWVITLGGAFFVFNYFLFLGLAVALIGGFFGMVPGIILIVFLEFMLSFSELKRQSLKQTEILEKIYQEVKKESEDG